jgi:hypothetical protein
MVVIAATASERLPPSRAWTRSRTGHVATTIMIAQVMAGRNGCAIQTQLAMSAPSASSWKVVRARSGDRGVLIARRPARRVSIVPVGP